MSSAKQFQTFTAQAAGLPVFIAHESKPGGGFLLRAASDASEAHNLWRLGAAPRSATNLMASSGDRGSLLGDTPGRGLGEYPGLPLIRPKTKAGISSKSSECHQFSDRSSNQDTHDVWETQVKPNPARSPVAKRKQI